MSEEERSNFDLELEIQKLKQEARELTGGEMFSYASSDCPPEVEAQFWKQIVEFERAAWVKPFDRLVEAGISPPPPEHLDDAQLAARLWEVINGLALLRTYLFNTDHLSDRELYTHLWNHSLREEVVMLPENPDYACYIDLIGSGTEEDISIFLKYYADDDERQRWAREWPDEALPDRERLPFDRDRRLPQSDASDQFHD